MAWVLDYLCLKLSKVSEDILDVPYYDCLRKFNSYRALDSLNRSLPIIAYPVMTEEANNMSQKRLREAEEDFYKTIGIGMEDRTKVVPHTKSGIPETIEDLFRKHIPEEMLREDGIIDV